mmetsp:Transcript_4262/g.8253  ORF Transcript_4262/g.8253 Transcript_4262/m.8253 type:complete len:88 (-) Transcript_4262:1510-1773(-)
MCPPRHDTVGRRKTLTTRRCFFVHVTGARGTYIRLRTVSHVPGTREEKNRSSDDATANFVGDGRPSPPHRALSSPLSRNVHHPRLRP